MFTNKRRTRCVILAIALMVAAYCAFRTPHSALAQQTGSPIIRTTFTVGSIPYVSTGRILRDNNANLRWDNATTTLLANRVYVGTTLVDPGPNNLHVEGSFRITSPNTTQTALILRRGTGNSNGDYWSFQAQNAAATDNLIFGQSSSAFTTGGFAPWVGNSNAFLYFNSGQQFRIGSGVGSTPQLVVFGGGGVGIGTATNPGANNLRVQDNVQTGSGTSFVGTLDHAITADRTWTLPDATDTLVGRATTDTLTNKTLDAEATGNVISQPEKVWLPAAVCNNTTPGTIFSIPTTTPVVGATCFGTSPQRFGALDLTDAVNANTVTAHLTLPGDWTSTGGLDLKFVWFSASTSTNSVVWTVATACIADGDDLLAPTFNATQTVADANNATANTRNSAAITGVTTTGCAAGETLFLRLGRDATDAGDTLAATASLIGVEVTYRRAM